MKIALIDSTSVIRVWTLPAGQTELAIRYTLPDGKQVSPIVLGWSKGGFSVVEVTEFTMPDGKQAAGGPSYTVEAGGAVESFEVEDIPVLRPMVRKSTVQARIIEAGKMTQAYAALTANPTNFARWFAPDRPQVYCDDPDAVALVQYLELDPAVILEAE